MTERNRILIILSSDLYVRNFLFTGAFDLLKRDYDVLYAYPYPINDLKSKIIITSEIKASDINIAGKFTYTEQRNKQLYFLTELSMVKLRKKCSTFQIKYDLQLGRKKKLLFRILSLPIIYRIFYHLFMAYMGRCKDIDGLLKKVRPDLVIIPTSLIDSVSIDVITSAKYHHIKSLMLINGWDNISSKGTIPQMPDYLGVWGEQSVKHAVFIHNMPKERVFPIGAPHYDIFKIPTRKREDIRRENNLPVDKMVILFAGSARTFDETSVLVEIEKAIEDGQLPDIHILYRPHPWRHRRIKEDSFYDHSFKHITMDKQLSGSYLKSKIDFNFVPLPKNVLPDMNYYPDLYAAVDAIIHPLTTIAIEGAIIGIPSLAIAFNDGVHKFTSDTIIKYDNVKDIRNMPGIIVCDEKDLFIDSCRELIKLINDKEVSQQLKKAIRFIVNIDETTYSDKLLNLTNRILK